MADQNFRVKRGLEVGFGGTVMTALPGGNVGIGTTNPRSGLEVQGTDGARITRALTGGNFSGYKFHINNPSGNSFNLNVGRVFNDNVATSLFNITQNGDIVPAASGQIDLGSSSITWENIYGETLYTDDKIVHRGDTNTFIRFPAADTFTVETAGNERLRVTSAGNVGIGTNAPTRELQVAAEVPQVSLISTNSTLTEFLFGDLADDNIGRLRYDHSDDSLELWTNAAPRLYIDSNGDVGIGTATPSNLLHVYHATNNEIARFQSGDATCYISFRDSDSSSGATSRPILGAKGDNMFFQTGGSERLRITSDGKFGFGTNNPQGIVHISSGTSGDATLILEADTDNNNEADNPNIIFRQDGGLDLGAIGMNLTNSSSVGPSNELYLAASSGDAAIVFATGTTNGYTNATEKLRITSGGDVGIGTATPTAKLDVAGHIKLDSGPVLENSASNGVLKITSASGYLEVGSQNINWAHFSTDRAKYYFNRRIIVNEGIIGSYDEDLVLVTDQNEERIRIKNDTGNVGIGTATPATMLDVRSSSGTDFLTLGADRNNSNTEVGISFKDRNVVVGLQTAARIHSLREGSAASFSLVFSTSDTTTAPAATEKLRITSDGNVGINSDAPTAKLDVNGTVNVSGVSTFASHVHLGDDDELRFGAANDFKIVHDPNDCRFENSNGDIKFKNTGSYFFFDEDGGETLASFINDGAVNLYYDNSKKFETTNTGINVSGNITGSGDLTLTDTDAGSSAGPELKLYRNSGTPADADYLGQIKFAGESDTGVERNYAKITGKILDASNTNEDGIIEFAHIKAGSQNISARFRSDSLQLLNGTNFTVDGTSTFTGSISFPDSSGDTVGRALFGDSDDLRIYHDGVNSYVSEVGAGDLRLSGNVVKINNGNNTATMIKATQGGSVELNHNGSKKLETTDAGATVTGILTATTFSGSGANLTNVDATTLDGIDSGSFIRSDANDDVSAHTEWQDNYEIRLGNSADFRMEFNGSDTVFRSYAHADGDIVFQGETSGGTNQNIMLLKTDGTETYVNLRHNNITRMETSSGGITVSGIATATTLYGVSGSYAAGTDTATDAAIVIEEEGTIYTKDGAYLRRLIEKKSDIINIGQHNTALIDGIELKPGNAGSVKLHNGAAGPSVKLETTGYGVTVTGIVSATSFSGSGANLTSVDAATLDGIDSANFLRSNVADTASGAITFNAGLTMGSSQILNHNNTPSRDKIRVWSNNNYTIGMDNGITFGGINNDYAMTFQMNNDDDRGWWFGDVSHTDAQGAMSVTTQGKMSLAHSLRLGYGESDTTTPGATYELDVSGDIYASGGLTVSGISTFAGAIDTAADGDVNVGDGSADARILIKKADNNTSDHIQFYNGTTRIGEIGCHDNSWLRINQVTNKNIYTPRYIRADAGFFVDGTTKGINGSGNFIGGTIAGASDYGTLLRSDTDDTMTGALTIDVDNKENGALRINANQTNPENDFYFAQEIVSTLSGTTATTADREQGGLFIDVNSTATGGDTNHEHRAYGIYVDLDITGDADIAYGVASYTTSTPTTGTVSATTALYGWAEDNGGAGSVSYVYGVQGYGYSDNSNSDTNYLFGGSFKVYNAADSAVVGEAIGCRAEVEITSGSGDKYGDCYVFSAEYDNNDIQQTHTSYLYYGSYAGNLPTNPYGIYIAQAVDNYFAGSLGIGTDNPTATLEVKGSGSEGTGTGTGQTVAKFTGDSDGLEIRNISAGDYGIYNSAVDTGLEIYDGLFGVRILYNGNVGLEFGTTNNYGDFKGTPTVNGDDIWHAGNKPANYAKYVGTGTPNLNSSTSYNELSWINTTPQFSNGTWSATAEHIVVPATGLYMIQLNLYMTASVARSNIGARLAVNDTEQTEIAANSYIRNYSGHTESSLNMSTTLSLSANDELSVYVARLAASGTVSLQGTNSTISITQLA